MSIDAVNDLFAIIKDYIEVKKELMRWTEVSFPELFSKQRFECFDVGDRSWIEIDNYDDLATADIIFSNFSLKNKKAFAVDLDGTLYVGTEPITEAVDFLIQNKNKYDFHYITNNTSKIPQDYIDRLLQLGIDVNENNILTPLAALIREIKKKEITEIFLIANKKVTDYLKKCLPNVNFNNTNPEVVVLTYDTEITYHKLANACVILNKDQDIKYWATHTDIICPTENGDIPDIGSFIDVLAKSTRRSPDMVFGKPNQEMLGGLLSSYKKEEIAVIGDRLYTDKVMADNAGCDFVCVLSGDSTRSDVDMESLQPSITVKNLGVLASLSS